MDRAQLQRLAEARLEDARVLVEQKRWAAAYYLCGYVVECGLKACLLKHLGESGAIYGDEKYLKRLAECWTHDLAKLVSLAGLEKEFGTARAANAALGAFWTEAKDWTETSRYEENDAQDAMLMYEAVGHDPDGVFLWIRSRW